MAGGDRTNSEVLVYRLRNTVTDHWVAQTSRLLRCLRSVAAHMANCTMCAPPKALVLLFRNRSTRGSLMAEFIHFCRADLVLFRPDQPRTRAPTHGFASTEFPRRFLSSEAAVPQSH